jgi:hypothetical protein
MKNDFKLDFIGIGASKCGTTWIFKCLNDHPQIFTPPKKELTFFSTNPLWRGSTNHDRGEKWLKKKFSNSKQGQIKGEISPTYIVDPSSPMLIKEHNPDTKIIVAYRNPVDALYSFYHMINRLYSTTKTFEEFIDCNAHYVETGFFYSQTMHFLKYLDKENFNFVVYDDIVEKPDVVISSLYKFLGVDSSFVPPSLHNKVNIASGAKFELLKNIMGNASETLKSSSLGLKYNSFLNKLGVHDICRWIQQKNLKPAVFPPIKPETRSRLIDLYSKENLLLGKLINKDLSSWNELS